MKTHIKFIIIGLLFFLITPSIYGQPQMKQIQPPDAKKVYTADTLHNDIRVDYYYWMRDKENPDVIEYLKAENAYTDKVMADTEDLQKSLFEEMKARKKQTDLSVPEKIGDYYYYSRTEEGKQYSIICRKRDNLDAEEQILLDQNKWAARFDYFDLYNYEISPNHKLMAFAIDTTASENYTIYFKNLDTNEILDEKIENADGDLEWANDNKTIFYTMLDDTKRPYRILKHCLGTDPENDEIIYTEDDKAFFVWISKTRSRKYLLIGTASKITSEMHYLHADKPNEEFKLFSPREKDVKYYISHHGDYFYIFTNDKAKNFKLMRSPLDVTSKDNWEEFIPHRKSVLLESFDLFEHHLVLYERKRGLSYIRVKNFETNEDFYIDYPEPVYACWPTGNSEYNKNELRFYYTSFITPGSIYDYNMDTKERELLKQYEVLGKYDPDNYVTERIFARAPDDTLIPVSLVYHKKIELDGTNPLLLTGYGAYGSSAETYFSSNRLSLLNRGFIYAKAHIRGGEDMGRYWYEQGKLLHKKNTFTDFIACAEHLIEKKYTSADELAIQGGSAGGLLVGAVLNLRPDLFEAAIANVPFVDVLNTMLDPSIPLTVTEYDEWGNPNNEKYYHYIKSYAPYENVKNAAYPHMLVTAGLNDPRVPYWEAAKWVAKLRDMKKGDNLLLLKTDMKTGHMGASGRYDYLNDIAFEYAFLFKVFGIELEE